MRPLVVVADGCPNFSICGLPFYLSGETPDWRDLAHRDHGGLEAAGLRLRLRGRRRGGRARGDGARLRRR